MRRTYRPVSYSVDAMGEISEFMEMRPSKGRAASGFTIFASTYAIALGKSNQEPSKTVVQVSVNMQKDSH